MRKKTEADTSDEPLAEKTATSRSNQAWAMLIKRVYEVDPLCCPECGGQMKVVTAVSNLKASLRENTFWNSAVGSGLFMIFSCWSTNGKSGW